jgi:HK97 family phage prohead protease
MTTKSLDFTFDIKSSDDEGTFDGYASPFGGPADSYGDVVEPGAYADSLARHRRQGTMPLMLWQHDTNEPIGVWQEFAEDGKGLWGKGKLLRGVQKADEAYIRLKAGAVRGLSIGFREVEAKPDGAVRRLKKLDLLEVSIVSFPAAARARVSNVKSEDITNLGERWQAWARSVRDGEPPAIKDFEQLLRDAGVPKSVAVAIASVGYAKSFRGEPEGGAKAQHDDAAAMLALLRDAVGAFK